MVPHTRIERINRLVTEYDVVMWALAFPYSFAEMQQLKERRKSIRAEGKALAKRLKIPDPFTR